MPYDDRIEELISAYTLGVLDGNELKELEDYIRKNPGVYQELINENEAVFSQLAYVLKVSSPRPGLRNELLSDIQKEKKVYEIETKPPFWQRLQPLWLGLGSAVAAILIISLFTYSSSLNNTVKEQQAKISNLEALISEKDSELALLQEEFGSQSEMLAFLDNPEVVIINLVKTEPNLKAVARVLWNPGDDEALFYGINLPEVPEGKTYQLWAIAGEKPESLGVFNVDNHGNNVHLIKSLSNFGDIGTFAVSLEPAGGVPLPTGKVYLAGEI
ncbi:MAG: hypothetical protein DHS20C13_11020 [Thermodesulfobacteriota bacterium]|nr:MAG: hypothetical protein DHS20C13_11020 [Thermodesulfobacteriota bacterium]